MVAKGAEEQGKAVEASEEVKTQVRQGSVAISHVDMDPLVRRGTTDVPSITVERQTQIQDILSSSNQIRR